MTAILATVLFTDIVDSTATLAARRRHRLARPAARAQPRAADALNAYRGREVTTTGDGFLAVFDGATRAVRCGAAMIRAVAPARPVDSRRDPHRRGRVRRRRARGLAVHAAARVMSLAGPAEVLVSATTRDLLEGSDTVLQDAGVHELKGLPGARQVSRVITTRR